MRNKHAGQRLILFECSIRKRWGFSQTRTGRISGLEPRSSKVGKVGGVLQRGRIEFDPENIAACAINMNAHFRLDAS